MKNFNNKSISLNVIKNYSKTKRLDFNSLNSLNLCCFYYPKMFYN